MQKGEGIEIEYHADDYGISMEQCRRILDCHVNGLLNGISIMPNTDILEEAMATVEPYKGQISYTMHLNLRDGKANSDKNAVPHLVDNNGVFKVSFGKYVMGSYLPWMRKTLRKEISIEFKAQIDRLKPYFKDGGIRLDSHGHYHMVPVIFDALVDVIRQDNLEVDFIRIPRENVRLYLSHRKEIKSISLINFIKVAILNTYAKRNIRKYPNIFDKASPYDFMGVMLSGHMSYDNVLPVYRDAIDRARQEGRNIEILFHPGAVHEKDALLKLNPEGRWFFVDPWRDQEADALKRLPAV